MPIGYMGCGWERCTCHCVYCAAWCGALLCTAMFMYGGMHMYCCGAFTRDA